jgi:hypothetical protein
MACTAEVRNGSIRHDLASPNLIPDEFSPRLPVFSTTYQQMAVAADARENTSSTNLWIVACKRAVSEGSGVFYDISAGSIHHRRTRPRHTSTGTRLVSRGVYNISADGIHCRRIEDNPPQQPISASRLAKELSLWLPVFSVTHTSTDGLHCRNMGLQHTSLANFFISTSSKRRAFLASSRFFYDRSV